MFKNSGSGLRSLWLLKNFKGSKRFKDTSFKKKQTEETAAGSSKGLVARCGVPPCTCNVSL
jgi:hypothetical protein